MAKKCPIAPKNLVQLYEKAGRIYADKSISLLSDKVLKDVLTSDRDYNLTNPGDVDLMGTKFVDTLFGSIVNTNNVDKEQRFFFDKIDNGLRAKTGDEYEPEDLYDHFFEGAYSQVENYYQDNKIAIIKSAMKMDLSEKKAHQKNAVTPTQQMIVGDASAKNISDWAKYLKLDLSSAEEEGISDEMIAKRVWLAENASGEDGFDFWINYADNRGWDAEKIDIFLGLA